MSDFSLPRHRKNRLRFFKRSGVLFWLALCGFALLQTFMGRYQSLILIPLPFLVGVGLWLSFYGLTLIHEFGHALAGYLLGFSIQGIEIGPFPYKTLKIKKFTLHIGRLPGNGRTILGPRIKSHSRIQQFCFLASGLLLEFAFFTLMFHALSGFFWLKLFLILFYLDQLWVNLVPAFENGLGANDGALLMEVLFPKKSLYEAARSLGKDS